MLYKSIVLHYPSPYNQFGLPSGVLGLVELSLAEGAQMKLIMHQVFPDTIHLKQDRSIEGWISTLQGGNPVVQNPINLTNWKLTTLQKTVITIYDENISIEPCEHPVIPLAPGTYWLNLLNLVNESNAFFLEIISGDQ